MSLRIEHIAKAFGEKEVLHDVSFSLKKGQIKVLMGANGSGKTTLFNIITGFLRADKGNVLLHYKSLKKVAPHLINRLRISRTFQDIRLIKDLTVLENMLLAYNMQEGEKWWKGLLPNKSVKKEQQGNRDDAMHLLKKYFIDGVATSKAGEISYGQQKLLNLACCVANDADVVLLDEPVTGVNPIYRAKLESVIKEMKQQDKALLIIEHNTDFIEAIADEILFLNGGRIVKFADYASFRSNEMVQEVYI